MKTRSIEIDDVTATTLARRAAERGVSVPELVAELVSLDAESASVTTADIVELDDRWKAFETQKISVGNDDVVRWLETWGTSAFRKWQER